LVFPRYCYPPDPLYGQTYTERDIGILSVPVNDWNMAAFHGRLPWQLEAVVDEVENTSLLAKAGLMMREGSSTVTPWSGPRPLSGCG
jgi:hypothetical protein